MTTAVTFSESVDCAKAHILNIYDMYAVIADNAVDAKHSRLRFGELVGEFMLWSEQLGWLSKFPEWARVDYSVIISALDELVEEWEE